MKSAIWVLVLLMDDGSGTFPFQQVQAQYFTKAECVAQRDMINQNADRVRAECYSFTATKEK